MNAKYLQVTSMFTESRSLLSCKDWKKSLSRLNKIIETCDASVNAHLTKAFEEAEFLVGYTLIIKASCYC